MKKALVLSSLGYNTGCALRAEYLARALSRAGWEARYIRPPLPSLPAALEVFLCLPLYLWETLIFRPDLAVGIKPYPSVWLPLFLARLLGALSVADVDDLDGGYRGGCLGFLGRLSQAPAYKLIRYFSTHHPGLRHMLTRDQGIAPRRIVWLEQGVDTSVFPETGRAPGFKAKNADGRCQGILLFAAHLNVACEFPLLLEFVGPLLKQRPGLTLVAAGGGPRLGEFRQMAVAAGLKTRIRFTGQLSPREIGHWMSRATVCLALYSSSPSNGYRVPMKVGEYLAMGRPVVTNVIAGLSGLARFIYATPLEPEAYRQRIRDILDHGGDGRNSTGRQWVRTRLNWDAVAQRYLRQLGRASHAR